MSLKELPASFAEWKTVRNQHLQNDLERSHYTTDLYKQYKKHLGAGRFRILKESQKMVVPEFVNRLLRLGKPTWIRTLLLLYKFSRKIKMNGIVWSIILPPAYKKQIQELDIVETS